MRPLRNQSIRIAAIQAIAEIAAAIEAFNCGETNVSDTLDAISVVVGAYQAAARSEPRRDAA